MEKTAVVYPKVKCDSDGKPTELALEQEDWDKLIGIKVRPPRTQPPISTSRHTNYLTV